MTSPDRRGADDFNRIAAELSRRATAVAKARTAATAASWLAEYGRAALQEPAFAASVMGAKEAQAYTRLALSEMSAEINARALALANADIDIAYSDSGSGSQSEDPRSGAEAEGPQSGGSEASASPKTSSNSETPNP